MKLVLLLNLWLVFGFQVNGGLIGESPLDIEDLLNNSANRPEMEFLKDEEIMKSLNIDPRVHPDIILDSFLLTPGLIERRGYPAENHTLQTSDGYILEIHRIPGSPKSPPRPGKQPVFLMHGILDSSATWVLMGPEQGLAYLLADLGYDVWMGNARGSRYSRKHIDNDPDGWRGNRRRFWAFSWDEVGRIDLPHMIDYVSVHTGFPRMHYIGHSQGTTVFFVMCAEFPQYNDRIISMNALAPVAFLKNLKNPFVKSVALFMNSLDLATSILGIYEFMPNNDLLGLLGQAVCRDEAWLQIVCSNVLFLIAGYNSAQLNSTMLPVILGHTPAGSSTDQLIHYGQSIRAGYFRQYDHGMVTNLLRYGSIRPPKYNLRNIRAPVALHYSDNDWMVHPTDVAQLERNLGNVIGKFLVPDLRFNHLDFTWAIDARPLLYNRVIEIIKIYDQRERSFNHNRSNDTT